MMPGERIFRLTYRLTARDYASMSRAVTRRPLVRGLIVLTLWLFSAWCMLVFLTDIYNPIIMVRAIAASSTSLLTLVALFGIALLISVFSYWFCWAISFVYYRQLAMADAEFTMTLSGAGIEANSTIGDTKIPWATVKRIILERDHLFLSISKREAFILPRRGFASDAEFDAACNHAAERIAGRALDITPQGT